VLLLWKESDVPSYGKYCMRCDSVPSFGLHMLPIWKEISACTALEIEEMPTCALVLHGIGLQNFGACMGNIRVLPSYGKGSNVGPLSCVHAWRVRKFSAVQVC
jgi:hypothetical protein